MKYGEAWTGDVWKVVYYLLKYYHTHFQFQWFHHPNYRGVIMLYKITPFKIPEMGETINKINGFDYTIHFSEYLELLLSTQIQNKI